MRASLPLALPLMALGAMACSEATIALPGCPTGARLDTAGVCRATCDDARPCLLTERCNAGMCVAQEATLPTILHFRATPEVVPFGGDAEVEFVVIGAERLELQRTDDDVFETSILVVDNPSAGTHRVGQITSRTTLSLSAWTGDERAPGQNVVIRVEAEEDQVQIVSFSATPETVGVGEQTVLRWQVANATDILVAKAGELLADRLPARGELTDNVRADTEYRLVADGPGGPVESVVTVRVAEDRPPQVLTFDVTPPQSRITVGDNAVLSWTTADAERAFLLGGNGQVLASFNEWFQVEQGRWLVSPPAGTQSFTLKAEAEGSPPSTKTAVLTVATRPPVPELLTVQLNPTILPAQGEQNTEVTVYWTVSPETADVEVKTDRTTGVFTGSGQARLTVPTHSATRITVRAQVPGGGVAEELAIALPQSPEEEPNDIAAVANEITDRVRIAQLTRLQTRWEDDWYEIDISRGDTVYGALFSDQTGCMPGLSLSLYRGSTISPVKVETSGPNGQCPVVFDTAANVTRYRMLVSAANTPGGNQMVFPYALAAASYGPRCGDGVVSGREDCDDGNRAEGDACSPDCRLSPTHSYYVFEDPSPASAPGTDAQSATFSPYGPEPADDEGYAVIELPFPFPFFGRTFHGVMIMTNGYISFLPAPGGNFSPGDPNGEGGPNALVAMFGANLAFKPGGGVVHWDERRSDDNRRRYVIQFEQAGISGQPSSLVEGRIELYADGQVSIGYGELIVPDGAPFLAGIEGPEGEIQYSVLGCEAGCSPQELQDRSFTFLREAIAEPGG